MHLFVKTAVPLVALLSLAACEMPPGGLAGPSENLTAGLPAFAATCPGDISVHADAGGPVLVNGDKASVQRFTDTYLEASKGEFTASISINPDQSVSVAYTGAEGANGICTVAG